MDLSSFKVPEKKTTTIHSPLHDIVATLRKEFGETAKKGPGSFGFYLGLLKGIPPETLRLWLADIKDSKKLTTPEARRRVFWWRFKMSRAPRGTSAVPPA